MSIQFTKKGKNFEALIDPTILDSEIASLTQQLKDNEQAMSSLQKERAKLDIELRKSQGLKDGLVV